MLAVADYKVYFLRTGNGHSREMTERLARGLIEAFIEGFRTVFLSRVQASLPGNLARER